MNSACTAPAQIPDCLAGRNAGASASWGHNSVGVCATLEYKVLREHIHHLGVGDNRIFYGFQKCLLNRLLKLGSVPGIVDCSAAGQCLQVAVLGGIHGDG
ncbi:hypothetical protein SDC9_117821 [bioreactor metagenome]|uniref:Uncharacterized protein n=1 Tax=bioreactor metagenome TaxID=1076179 RepID=A0A645BZC5_9ZZZZ